MTAIDLALDKIEERQNEMKHETKLRFNADYAMDYLGLPEIITQLEHISNQLSDLGHEVCVRQLINKLEDY